MALSYRARKRLAYLVLLVGMPVYVVVAVTLIGWFDRLPVWAEFLLYAVLGIAWVFPFKALFRGTARPDPDAPPPEE